MKRLAGKLGPGLMACAVCAMAATFLSDHYGGPTMLFALLLGIAFNFLNEPENTCFAGIQVASNNILRVGVALLGARITLDQIMGVGIGPIIVVVALVCGTVVFGAVLSRLMKLDTKFGVLTGGAVGICGVSAALAIAAILPKGEDTERYTLFAVIGVTALSTIAMIFYPLMVDLLNLTHQQSGFFIGATIHDVAQVVGAGYSISDVSGDIATFTKLIRVAMLLPVVFILSLFFHTASKESGPDSGSRIPLFLVFFVLIMLMTSSGVVPIVVVNLLVDVSRACLIVAVAAIGMKTSLKELTLLGKTPVMLMVGETLFLAITTTILLKMEIL